MSTTDKNQIKTEIENLRTLIEEHNYRYYILSDPSINDTDFDFLLHRLEELEEAHPEFLSSTSPTQRVGSDKNEAFRQEVHQTPMLSLSNTYNYNEIASFYEKVKQSLSGEVAITAELKFDGASISVTYKNGKLFRAITRGDGTIGDDVTSNIKTIRTLPMRLRGAMTSKDIEIRGEVLLPYSSFERINEERKKQGEPPFANPRNAASGSLKSLNSSVVSDRKLDLIIYSVLGETSLLSSSHFNRLSQAKEAGLKTSPYVRRCLSLQEIYDFVSYWDVHRHDLPFATDGIVLKVDSIDQQNILGTTSKYPRWAIAYKYQAENVKTKLQDVIFQVGRTGVITPVAVLDPVLISGTIVKRATLHNKDFIKQLDLRKNDYVYIEKGGEIIPKITAVDASIRDQQNPPIEFPAVCPDCQTLLQQVEEDVAIVCPNTSGCPTQAMGRIEHYCGRKAADIRIGPETIALLYQKSIIRGIDDLYLLNPSHFSDLRGFKEKSVSNLLNSIESSKNRPFSALLFGLGIKFVGETTAKQLSKYFHNIQQLQKATTEELLVIPEIGEKIAEQIVLYFQNPQTRGLIERLLDLGVLRQERDPSEEDTEMSDKQEEQILEGKTIVVSGVFSRMSRDEYKYQIEKWGGKISSSVSSKTSFILAGENMGPGKRNKAHSLNVPIISEDEFWNTIVQNNQ